VLCPKKTATVNFSLLLASPLLALLLLGMLTVQAYQKKACASLKKLRHAVALFFVWCWLSCLPGISNLMFVALEGPAPPLNTSPPAHSAQPHTTIIVMGSGEMHVRPNIIAPRLDANGWERLHMGIKLWQQTGGKLILTGGPSSAPHPSLAGEMSLVAQAMGVPPAAIELALGSENTYQDLRSAQPLITPGSQVWLVTSAIHMPRSMAVARQLGIQAQPYPVDYRQIRHLSWVSWLPDNDGNVRFQTAAHEWVGRFYYRLKGWAD
jgi:uncharacterized SAM-binding protein YcdF (DUF218 family)